MSRLCRSEITAIVLQWVAWKEPSEKLLLLLGYASLDIISIEQWSTTYSLNSQPIHWIHNPFTGFTFHSLEFKPLTWFMVGTTDFLGDSSIVRAFSIVLWVNGPEDQLTDIFPISIEKIKCIPFSLRTSFLQTKEERGFENNFVFVCWSLGRYSIFQSNSNWLPRRVVSVPYVIATTANCRVPYI